MTMTPLDLLLIGNESLTRECGEIARARGHRIAAVVTRHAGTAAWAREAGIPVHAPQALRDGSLDGTAVDWLLSIANLTLVPDAVKSFCPVTMANGQLNALGLFLSILMTL